MVNCYWNIEDGNGTDLTQGIDNQIVARRTAQRMANERGESVYLYVGSTSDTDADVDTEIESEEIVPE